MGRPGELYDQDQEQPPAREPAGPVHAGRGVLFDQDAPPGPKRRTHSQRDEERRREREIQLRRDAPPPPATPTKDPPRLPGVTGRSGPVRITSRAAPLVRLPGPPPEPPLREPSPPPPAPPTPAASPAPAAPPPLAPSAPSQPPAPQPPPPPPPPPLPPPRQRPTPRHKARSGQSTGQATAVLAVGTLASRVTGFVRVLVIGYVLGVGTLSDAFNYANGVPNIVYDLLLGGILSATLIPVFVEQLHRDDPRERVRSISAILTAVAAALVVMSGLLWLLAPWVIRFYLVLNSTSATGPAERALATHLLRYFAPQVFLLGAIVVSTALLNARRRFTAAALSPVLNNLIAIAALLATKFVASSILTAPHATAGSTLTAFARDERAILILGAGTTAGYLFQLLAQLPAMHRAGLRLRPVWDLRHPAVRRVASLSSWLVGVVVANQAALALVMILAARKGGDLTAYQFSFQFFQLPYALVAVSIASAIMPDLAERWTADQRVDFERRFVTGLRVTLALLVPVAVIYAAVAHPFIQLALHHGRVGASGAHLVGTSLIYFAAGLPGFSSFFLLMRAYQAMQDARTMFWIYVLENGLTLASAPLLDLAIGEPGLALAWVGPYSVASVLAVVLLRKRIGSLGGWLTIRSLMRIAIASAAALGVTIALGIPFPGRESDPVLVGRLAVQAGAGITVYLYLAKALAIRELRPVMAVARRFAGLR